LRIESAEAADWSPFGGKKWDAQNYHLPIKLCIKLSRGKTLSETLSDFRMEWSVEVRERLLFGR